MSNTASITAADVQSDPIKAEHTGKHTLDIDFSAGVTGTVRILSRPIGGVFKPERWDAGNAEGDIAELTASQAFIVPGNREYAIIATAKGGDAGAITATLNEVEKPN